MYEQCLSRIALALLLAGSACSRDALEPDQLRPADTVEVSPPTIVDQAPVQRPALGRWPAAAFDGTQYLVVWEDHRARRPILYGGRVAADGTALDGIGFPILDALPSAREMFEYEPAVASDGTNFLVVTEVAGQIAGARVSASGELLDDGGILIAAPDGRPSRPSLIHAGEHYLVAWTLASDAEELSGVYWARVKSDGTVLDPEGVRGPALQETWQSSPVGVSFDGSNHLLSWARGASLLAARVAVDGTLIDETPLAINPPSRWLASELGPAAGFDGTNHVIAWIGERERGEGFERHLMASRVTPELELLDADGIELVTLESEWTQVDRLSLVAGDGRSVVLASSLRWGSSEEDAGQPEAPPVRVAELDTEGTVSVHPADERTTGLNATMAAHSDGALLLWRAGQRLYGDDLPIVGTLLDAAGTPVVGSVVAPASPASRQEVKSVANDGQMTFVVWTDTRDQLSEGPALYAARLSNAIEPLDAEPVQISAEPTGSAAVTFDGANFVVAWTGAASNDEATPIQVVRVSPAGERLDVEPLQSSLVSSQGDLALASDGVNALLVGETNPSALAAVLIDQSGVIGDPIQILDCCRNVVDPQASFDGTGYLVAWHDTEKIFAQRIGQDGALAGRFAVLRRERVAHLAIAAGGGHHLLVWRDEHGLSAARVSQTGQPVLDLNGRLLVPLAPTLQESQSCTPGFIRTTESCPSVVFDGSRFVIAWQAPTTADDPSSLDLLGAIVSTELEVVQQFPIASDPESEGAPLLVSANGRVLAAYDQFVPGPPYDTRRALVRTIEP